MKHINFHHFSRLSAALLTVAASVTILSGCQPNGPNSATTGNADQAQVIQAQSEHWRKKEVTVRAQIDKMLPPDTQGIPHQRFLIGLGNGTTVLIAHDTKMAEEVPIEKGDSIIIHGEYIWNSRGGVIHWTHHTDSGTHEGGWIEYKGKRYQ